MFSFVHNEKFQPSDNHRDLSADFFHENKFKLTKTIFSRRYFFKFISYCVIHIKFVICNNV